MPITLHRRLLLALLYGCVTLAAGCANLNTSQPALIGNTNASASATLAHEPIIPTGPLSKLDEALAANTIQVASQSPPLDMWDRIRRGFAMPDLVDNVVDTRVEWYAARPDYMDRMALRSSRYIFYIVDELERRRMPTELALLPFIESAFNPQAVSSAKAAGMWQFMPATGRSFDLRQNSFR
ncbi:MAG: transglycosylase SLT domain-containing protein, partial [Burkholderiaceae bacterium]